MRTRCANPARPRVVGERTLRRTGGEPLMRASGFDRSRKRCLVGVAALLLAGAFLRVYHIDYDPPAWMSPDYLTDEGWWADAARGKVYFDNYFSDDFGTALLMAPAYTGLLVVVYDLFGVGTTQTRVVAAAASTLTAAAVAALLWRAVSPGVSLFASVLLTASPFAWAYARVGLIEWTQALFLTAAFCLWLRGGGRAVRSAAGGALLGVAVWCKPDIVFSGGIPIVAAIVAAGAHWKRRSPVDIFGSTESGPRPLSSARDVLFALAGIAAAAAVGIVVVVLPHWHAYWAMALSESHAANRSIAQLFTLPGAALVSTIFTGTNTLPTWWQVAMYSPALMLGAWSLGLSLAGGRPGLGVKPLGPARARLLGAAGRTGGRAARLRFGAAHPAFERSVAAAGFDSAEIGCLVFFVGQLVMLALSPQQPDRRYVEVIPAAAMCAAIAAARARMMFARNVGSARYNPLAGRTPARLLRSFGRWLLVSIPLIIVVKPVVTMYVMRAAGTTNVGRHPGLSFAAAGTIAAAAMILVIAGLSPWRRTSRRLCRFLGTYAPAAALAVALFVEIPIVTVSLFGSGATFMQMQRSLALAAAEANVVMGHVATSVFMPYRVLTVRRTRPDDESPPPNPGIWAATEPRFIIELSRYDYFPQTPRYTDLIDAHHYGFVRRYTVGPYRDGHPKFTFELYRREAPANP